MKALLTLTIFLVGTYSLMASDSNKDPFANVPASEMFWSLFREKNVIGKNDCSNKCGRYVRELRRQGLEADIVVIRPYTGRYLHAIVKLTGKNGKITYLDPTKGIILYKLDNLGSLKKIIAYKNLESMGDQYK